MTKDISLRNDMPAPSEWGLMRDMAASLVPTGFLPDSIKTPEQAMAIMLKGRELNVPAMYSMSNIAIVKGKPTISAEMMLALIYRDHGKKAIRVKSSDDNQCTVEYRLEGWDDISSYTFTIEQAQKANLTRNPTWSSYPAAMLRARCISAVARMAFPESIAGMYVPGELGEDVTVSDEGEVMSLSAPSMTATIEEPPAFDRESKMRELHAVGREAKMTHDHIHAAAVAKNEIYESTHDLTDDEMQSLIDAIRQQPDRIRAFAERRMAQKAAQNTTDATQGDESAEQEESSADDGYEPSQAVIEIPADFEAEYRKKNGADKYTTI